MKDALAAVLARLNENERRIKERGDAWIEIGPEVFAHLETAANACEPPKALRVAKSRMLGIKASTGIAVFGLSSRVPHEGPTIADSRLTFTPDITCRIRVVADLGRVYVFEKKVGARSQVEQTVRESRPVLLATVEPEVFRDTAVAEKFVIDFLKLAADEDVTNDSVCDAVLNEFNDMVERVGRPIGFDSDT